MLSRLQLKQIKAALKGMASWHEAPKDYQSRYWLNKEDVEALLETFTEEAPPKPKTPKKDFSRPSNVTS